MVQLWIHQIKRIFLLILLQLVSSLLFAASFRNPRLNSENKLLFEAESYFGKALVQTDVFDDKVFNILTCYPEKMELLSNGSVLQIRNQFGTARYSSISNNLIWTSRSNFFVGIQTNPEIVSFDGKWLCFVRRKNAVKGELILKDTETSEEIVLCDDSDFSFKTIPAKWSPDSSILLYEKNGKLYFCDPIAAFRNLQPDERFREIGDGNINQIEWAESFVGKHDIVYIKENIVYRIRSNELHTRGLYRQLVGIGSESQKLPFTFDNLTDRFWGDSDSIAVLKSGVVLTIIGSSSNVTISLSDTKASLIDCEVFWNSTEKNYVVWCSFSNKSVFYRVNGNQYSVFYTTNSNTKPSISPDGKYFAISSDKALEIREFSSWKMISRLEGENIISSIWYGKNSLYVGGEYSVRDFHFDSEKNMSRTLFLSSVTKSAWIGKNVVAQGNVGNFYEYDSSKSLWKKIDSSLPRFKQIEKAFKENQIQNGKYRTYIDSEEGSESVFVRTLTGNIETKDILGRNLYRKFDKNKNQKIELIFDAFDSDEGIDLILSVLDFYKIKATFFINGEFMRRYPQKTKLIAEKGHTCASMFFSNANLLESIEKGYVVDDEFIVRGLARNEDEFLSITGKELALLWHAPFYKANTAIRAAGEKAGYKYVEAGRFSLDTSTLEDSSNGKWYMNSSEIILFYINNASSCQKIPISVGKPRGKRSDYLYEKLDLLIDGLISLGFDF